MCTAELAGLKIGRATQKMSKGIDKFLFVLFALLALLFLLSAVRGISAVSEIGWWPAILTACWGVAFAALSLSRLMRSNSSAAARIAWKRYPYKGEPITMYFRQTDVAFRQRGVDSAMSYNGFTRLCETKDHFVLFCGQIAYIVPKRDIPEYYHSFRQDITRMTGLDMETI